MTNEEIVTLIKKGQKDLYLDLWDGCKNLVFLKASKRVEALNREDEISDLMQETYLILPEAVEQYDEAAGASFITFLLRFYAPRAFSKALYNGLSKSSKQDPIYNAESLNTLLPYADNESITLEDTIEDPSAEEMFLVLEDELFWHNMRNYLQKGISYLSDNQQIIINAIYQDGKSISECYRMKLCGDLSFARYAQIHKEGLAALKRWINGRGKRDGMKIGLFDCIYSSGFYKGGLRQFKYTHTSTVENEALKHDEHHRRLLSMEDILKSVANKGI